MPTGQVRQGGQLAEAVTLAGVLVNVLTGTGGPLADGENLPDLAGRLALMACAALDEREQARAAGQRIGRALAEANLTAAAAVEGAVTALGDHWLAAQRPGGPVDPGCVVAMQGGIAGGHTAAVRRLLLAQQDAIHRAAFQARDDAELAAYASHARFHAVFNTAGVGIGIADLQGRILAVNQALEQMLGYSLAELQGRRGAEIIHPREVARLAEGQAALQAGRIDALQLRTRCLHRDGGAVWADLSVRLVRDPAGQPLHQVAVVTNPAARTDGSGAPRPRRSGQT